MSDREDTTHNQNNAPGEPDMPGLTDDDALALDALIEAGYELDNVPAEMRDRAERVAGLLGLLESAETNAGLGALLSSATSAQAPKAAKALEPGLTDAKLTAPDSDALEALIESGWDASKTPRLFHERAGRIAALLSLLEPVMEQGSAEDAGADDLTERTFRMVELSRANDRRKKTADALRVRSRYSLRDIASVAAMILVVCSIGWPLISNLREGVRQSECAANMNAAGLGFTLYANDHKGQLPRQTKRLSATHSNAWWNVGEGRSNSANLFVLASEGYCTLGHLACPGNHSAATGLDHHEHQDWRKHEEVSYSYIIQGRRPHRWEGSARVVVLADRSPVIERARMGEEFDPEARSRNHRGRGENALFNDGSVVWLMHPVLENGDNIWLPGSIEASGSLRLKGTERPSREGDSFVGP